MNTKHTAGPFAVGDYAIAEEIEAAIQAHELSKPLGQMEYGRSAGRSILLQGEDAQWAVDTHCKGYAFPLTKAEDIYSVLLFGNEDAPYQVWGSTRVALRITDELERLA